MQKEVLVLPGDAETIESQFRYDGTVKVGPNIFSNPVTAPVAEKAGYFKVNTLKKGSVVYVDSANKRYTPALRDGVIGIVSGRHSEGFKVQLQEFSPAVQLNQNAFPNATKKNRVALANGAVVYGRIRSVDPNIETEMECLNSATGKADGYGVLKGGFLVDVPLAYVRKLYHEGGPVLEELGNLVSFEVVIGLNGKVWVNADDELTTFKVAQCIEQSASLEPSKVKELVSKVFSTQ